MTEDERLDIIEGEDEEGNPLFLAVETYFYYNGEEYVLLKDTNKPEDRFVMRVTVTTDREGEEVEEFEPVDPSLADNLLTSLFQHKKAEEQED